VYEIINRGYEAPEDPAVAAVPKQNIAGEQCAIGAYTGRLLQRNTS